MNIADFLEGKTISEAYQKLYDKSSLVSLAKGSIIVNQFARSRYLYFLLEGEVSFSIKVKDESEELVVGSTAQKYTPIGWSGFKEPNRYATSVKASTEVKLIRFDFALLNVLFESNPELGSDFLETISLKAYKLLLETRQVLANLVPASKQSFLQLNSFETIETDGPIQVLDTLRRSPFFEVFTEKELALLSNVSTVKELKRGEKLFSQDNNITDLSLLLKGRTALVYSVDKSKDRLDKRIVSSDGYLLSLEGCLSQSSHTETCVALKSSSILNFSLAKLLKLFAVESELAFHFYKRVLWYVSVRLRSARAKLIRVNYDGEISAVKHIIEQHVTELDVLSEIHKIPILLSNTITLKDAIAKLKILKNEGSSLEKRLSTNSLNMLSEVIKENDFYQGLASIYSSIANAPSLFTREEVRNLCAESFCDLFDKIGFHLSGLENLPKEPAIYIYNHLENHIYNTLPNSFQLTLDSHFISSVILYRELGNPGIRVVRVPKGEEYGHQLYYERLGHIPVYTQDSEDLNETNEEKRVRRSEFYQTAANYLNNGTSILLAPEGRSFTTEQSPGDFKAGAFVLASKLAKEPLIVPISVANFDKRLNRTSYSAVVQKPFKVSERVQDPTDREQMNIFLKELKNEFKAYIENTSQVSKEASWTHLF